MSRAHQPGQDVFRSVRPEDIDWQPFSAFPPPARLAVVVGEPAEPGPYVIRVKVPSGVKLMPHKHPEDRVYTSSTSAWAINSMTASWWRIRRGRKYRSEGHGSWHAARRILIAGTHKRGTAQISG